MKKLTLFKVFVDEMDSVCHHFVNTIWSWRQLEQVHKQQL